MDSFLQIFEAAKTKGIFEIVLFCSGYIFFYRIKTDRNADKNIINQVKEQFQEHTEDTKSSESLRKLDDTIHLSMREIKDEIIPMKSKITEFDKDIMNIKNNLNLALKTKFVMSHDEYRDFVNNIKKSLTIYVGFIETNIANYKNKGVEFINFFWDFVPKNIDKAHKELLVDGWSPELVKLLKNFDQRIIPWAEILVNKLILKYTTNGHSISSLNYELEEILDIALSKYRDLVLSTVIIKDNDSV